ncbi:hypothetical protein PsyrCH409_10805 [Pseudomonas viridiflava]|nr:hypothetical protein AO390_02945 [Pseudomonas marginalis ICMP 11289]PCK92051.1 hypothetical protein PsyrCH409_10805 [Pseudomonas viridiflava]
MAIAEWLAVPAAAIADAAAGVEQRFNPWQRLRRLAMMSLRAMENPVDPDVGIKSLLCPP